MSANLIRSRSAKAGPAAITSTRRSRNSRDGKTSSAVPSAVSSAFGSPDVIVLRDVPKPEPGPGRIRIAVRACGLAPADWAVVDGLLADRLPPLPRVLGTEVAGTVDVLGEGVTTEQAAALPMAAETAWQALDDLGVQPGELLLVHGAGSTVINTPSAAPGCRGDRHRRADPGRRPRSDRRPGDRLRRRHGRTRHRTGRRPRRPCPGHGPHRRPDRPRRGQAQPVPAARRQTHARPVTSPGGSAIRRFRERQRPLPGITSRALFLECTVSEKDARGAAVVRHGRHR
nr:alcohol dehydrogenase catalytic domain-containing protein [Streptomyces typhae]